MPQKRWHRPCKFCKGQYETTCMICGWKKERKKIKDMNNSELAELNGRRNRAQFLHDLDRGSTRAANASLGADLIDWSVQEHREWALEVYERVENGEDPKEIAKASQMTVKLITNMHKLVLGKMVRGDFAIETKPQFHPVPMPPEPEVLPAGVRRPLSAIETAMEEMAWESV